MMNEVKIPRADFAIIGGSGTLSSNFPKNFPAAQILEENLFFETPYGKSPAFRLCEVEGKNFLTCKMHGWRSGVTRADSSRQIFWTFRAAGVKMAVASSAPVEVIEKNLARANLRVFFEAVVGGDKVANGKPAPDIFLLAAEELNLPPNDCYIFEDSFNGIRSAAAASGVAIMIPDTVQPTEEIKNLCAAVFPNLSEARKAIEEGRL